MFDCGGEYICYGTDDCVFRIDNCFIGDNYASWGGGIYNSITTSTLTKCTFSGNTADDYGGGMYNYESSPTLTNCIFSDNSANCGGGMYNYERTKPTLTNCTFAGNSALHGNALVCDSNDQQYPGYLQLTNCILWDGGDQVWNNDNSTIIITYSDVQGGWPDVGNIDTDPLFADVNNGDYRLLAGSPCIDAAIEDGVYEDIDGNVRPFDFPGVDSVDSNDELFDFDMGAYEAVATTQCELIILPRTIIRSGGGEKMSAIMRLPELIVKDDIDAYEPLVLYPGAIEAVRQRLIPPSIEAKSNTSIHAVFDKGELFAVAGDNGDIELTVIGRFGTGEYFYGTDNIRIISPCDGQEQ
jgi:parallel beta-helix repeat protein